MSREIVSHRVNGLNESLLINVLDEPGHGNACHEYQIRRWKEGQDDDELCNIKFQDGPVGEVGVNGISNESLLAIVQDRLQSGEYECHENVVALTHLESVIYWLGRRTERRIRRGVEGTHEI